MEKTGASTCQGNYRRTDPRGAKMDGCAPVDSPRAIVLSAAITRHATLEQKPSVPRKKPSTSIFSTGSVAPSPSDSLGWGLVTPDPLQNHPTPLPSSSAAWPANHKPQKSAVSSPHPSLRTNQKINPIKSTPPRDLVSDVYKYTSCPPVAPQT